MEIKVEYSCSDDIKDLFVVKINGEGFCCGNFYVALERLKNKCYCGNDYADVWKCNNYRLTAANSYSPEEVIEALYGSKFLEEGDEWFYEC